MEVKNDLVFNIMTEQLVLYGYGNRMTEERQPKKMLDCVPLEGNKETPSERMVAGNFNLIEEVSTPWQASERSGNVTVRPGRTLCKRLSLINIKS